jgi:hypothetical protein
VTEHLEVRILPSGIALGRRRDGLPLTDEDRAMARQLAEDLRAQSKQPGISVADVLRVFDGARVVEQPNDIPKPSCCSHCDKESTPRWRRGGKIIQRVEPDGNRVWACHYCGRRSKTNFKNADQDQSHK